MQMFIATVRYASVFVFFAEMNETLELWRATNAQLSEASPTGAGKVRAAAHRAAIAGTLHRSKDSRSHGHLSNPWNWKTTKNIFNYDQNRPAVST